MRRITALIHAHNDERRLGRCLEMLYPCDNILLIDHDSNDRTLAIAHQYGAKLAKTHSKLNETPMAASGEEWLLCLSPRESLTEALAATLYEWKSDLISTKGNAFAFALREETGEGWIRSFTPEPRLVRWDWRHWKGAFPRQMASPSLDGELLRFSFP